LWAAWPRQLVHHPSALVSMYSDWKLQVFVETVAELGYLDCWTFLAALPFTFPVSILLSEYCLPLEGFLRKIRICRPCRLAVGRASQGSITGDLLCIRRGRTRLSLPRHILGSSRCKSGRNSIFRRSTEDTIFHHVEQWLCISLGRSRRICHIRCSDPSGADVFLGSLFRRRVVVPEILACKIGGRGAGAQSSKRSRSRLLL
jgi:hypothetical protein